MDMFSPFSAYTAGTYSLPETARFVVGDTSGGDITLNLPVGGFGPTFLFKKIVSAHRIVLVAPAGKQIEGASTLTISTNMQSVWVVRLETGDYYVVVTGSAGGGGTPIGACLRRQTYDPGTEVTAGPTTYGGTYGITGGSGTYPGAQRNAQDWDVVDWATPGMVNLGVNKRRVNILFDGVYDIDGIIEFNATSTENICLVFLNGYDTVGSHTGGQAATDGLEPNAGEFIALFGFSAGAASNILQVHTKIALHAGDFVFLGHQSDIPYKLNNFTNPHYTDQLPKFSVWKMGDIPS